MTPTSDLSEMTTIVVGASRGLGRGNTTAFAEAGAPVIAVARTAAPLADQAAERRNIQPEVADAGDPTIAGSLLDRLQPTAVILVAGARPVLRPLQHHTWETWSVNLHTDRTSLKANGTEAPLKSREMDESQKPAREANAQTPPRGPATTASASVAFGDAVVCG